MDASPGSDELETAPIRLEDRDVSVEVAFDDVDCDRFPVSASSPKSTRACRLISVIPEPSGFARMSGPAKPVSKSSARNRIEPFAPGKVAWALPAAHAVTTARTANASGLRRMSFSLR